MRLATSDVRDEREPTQNAPVSPSNMYDTPSAVCCAGPVKVGARMLLGAQHHVSSLPRMPAAVVSFKKRPKSEDDIDSINSPRSTVKLYCMVQRLIIACSSASRTMELVSASRDEKRAYPIASSGSGTPRYVLPSGVSLETLIGAISSRGNVVLNEGSLPAGFVTRGPRPPSSENTMGYARGAEFADFTSC